MLKQFTLHLPINSLSFGQVSVNILKEIYKRGLQPCVFPIGNNDISAYNLTDDFKSWLQSCLSKSLFEHKRTHPTFKLWHLNGSLETLSYKNVLFTFHETDQATPAELNTVQNNTLTMFSSNYSTEIFKNQGCQNVDVLHLGFDSDTFYPNNRKYVGDDRVIFNLAGKLEKRKAHIEILQYWTKKFGNDKKYMLNCAIYNNFIKPEDQSRIISNALGGKRFWNINLLPFMPSNEQYNDYLNYGHIDLTGLSRGEGFNLPSFQATCLGKYSVVLNAHAHKDWATKENSILVDPTGKIPVYDNMFFHENQPYNQGYIFDFNEESFIGGCEKALARYKNNPINEEGVKLKEQFTYAKTVDKILQKLEEIS